MKIDILHSILTSYLQLIKTMKQQWSERMKNYCNGNFGFQVNIIVLINYICARII